MQRELRLGDILDDYCPRERRLTNHAVVAMVGQDVKQTRCTTCDAEHEYKHAKIPRQRRKTEAPTALYSQVLATAPKRVTHDPPAESGGPVIADAAEADLDLDDESALPEITDERLIAAAEQIDSSDQTENDEDTDREEDGVEEGPVHRPLIRATLPRQEGQAPPARPAPDFTIRQPAGRPGRFRPRNPHAQQQAFGNRSNGNNAGGPPRGPRQNSGRPPQDGLSSRRERRHDHGRKRSK